MQSWPVLYRMPRQAQFAATHIDGMEGIQVHREVSPITVTKRGSMMMDIRMTYLDPSRPIRKSDVEIFRPAPEKPYTIIILKRSSKRSSVERSSRGATDDVNRKREEEVTFFMLLFAAASMILRPVTVDPVNATLSTS